MKKSVLFGAVSAALAAGILSAQMPGRGGAPASPPAQAEVTVAGKLISVKYSAPSVKGRQIFGDGGLLSKEKNYPVWRAGANAATAFHTDATLDIKGLTVPPGDYTLYVQVNPTPWQLIINKQTGQWGLTYNQAQDLGRVPMEMGKPSGVVETLRYTLTATGPSAGKLTLEWENVSASVPFTVKQ
jgi:hypothetical protein